MDHLSEVVPFCVERIGLKRFGLCLYGSGTVLMPSVNGV